MEKISLSLEGLGCANCATKIESRSKHIAGIQNVVLDYSRSKLTFEHMGGDPEVTISQIKEIVASLEPDVVVIRAGQIKDKDHGHTHDHGSGGHDKRALLRLSISLFFFIVGLITGDIPTLQLISLAIAYVVSGHKVLLRSFNNIRRGDIFDENFLMSIATFGAIAIGEYQIGRASWRERV